jgi:hypothetical protein
MVKIMTKITNLAGLLMLVILPLIGIAVTDHDLSEYMQFPPQTHYVEHAPFSQTVAVGLAIILIAVVLPFILRVGWATFAKNGDHSAASNVGNSNKSGAILLLGGLTIVAVFWYLSWNRLVWFANFQIYTFTPIWLGYILVVNGITQLRSGHCMLFDKTKLFIRLFVVSAIFWWFFEYLNRFVQNWYYIGIGELTPFEYFIYATLPFSTVLPAVLGTFDMLKTFPQLYIGLDNFSPWFTQPLRVLNSQLVQWGLLAFFAGGLTLIGVLPNYLFPLLWVSPLVIFSAISAIRGKKTILTKLTENDWREIVLLALASLICGFFWEMWNWHSVAKWIYEVPFVTKFKVFEMPLLGYSGYLPFGLECAVVARLFVGNVSSVTLHEKAETNNNKNFTTKTNIIATKLSSVMLYTNSLIIIALAAYFFLIPGFIVISNITDPALKAGRIPAAAWRLHKYLTPRYANWARERIKSKIAGKLNRYDVPATEWPLFGSVFYLWATSNCSLSFGSLLFLGHLLCCFSIQLLLYCCC